MAADFIRHAKHNPTRQGEHNPAATTRKLLEATGKTYQLSHDRGATGVGGVLEILRAEEVLSFARLAHCIMKALSANSV